MKLTREQQNSLHLFCQQLADELNNAGLDQRVVLKPGVQIPWNKQAIKDMLWRPIQLAMTQKESTTELDKHMEIDAIHSTLMRHLGEKFGIDYIPFPHDPTKISNFHAIIEK